MLYIDSIDQIDLGLSKPFWIIRVKKVSFWEKIMSRDFGLLKWPKIDLLILFWTDFYTIPTLKNPTKSLDCSKLSGKVEIWRKIV